MPGTSLEADNNIVDIRDTEGAVEPNVDCSAAVASPGRVTIPTTFRRSLRAVRTRLTLRR